MLAINIKIFLKKKKTKVCTRGYKNNIEIFLRKKTKKRERYRKQKLGFLVG